MNNTISAHSFRSQSLTFTVPLLLAAAVRLLGIASRPIWYDEAFAVLFSEKGPAAMLRGTLAVTGTAAADVHPLAYYTLLWLWMRLFGESLVAVRLLSILAGVGVVAVAILLTRQLFGPRTALVAGILVALAPFQVHYSQEIRMYSWLALLLLLATYCYWRGSQQPRWAWWLGFAVFAALAQYTQNLAAFYLIALALWPVIRRDWGTARWVLFSGLVALLLYLPWLVHLPAQFAKVDQSYWVDRPGFYRLFTLLLFFVTNLPLPAGALAAGLMIAMVVIAMAAMQTVQAVRLQQPGGERGLWLLYLAFAPAILMFLFSQWKPVYLERALVPSGAIFCLWLAWAMLETRAPIAMQALVACLVLAGFAIGLYQHVTDTGGIYGPYQAITRHLEEVRAPGDVIVHSNKLSMLPAVYFDRTLPQGYVADPSGSPQDTLAPATQDVLGLRAEPDLPTAIGDARRVWFIIFAESIQEYVDAGYPTHPQVTWLSEHYQLVNVQEWGTMRLYLFSKSP